MVTNYYISRCLQLAEKGLGKVSPNPMVGAVIVCDDKVIGEGFHEYYGGPHAEVNAIASVQDPTLLERSTMYVSLEPCCHYGKTPPCADLIIEKKIPNVVVCNRDPFEAVDGKGIEKLRAAGVNVQVGVKEDEGRWLNRRFFTFHEQKRPYVILKWAQSADGFLDKLRLSAEESPLKISTSETLALMHEFRSKESAVMVGPNTAIMDNPSLTVRLTEGKQPLRVLLDRDLKVPTTAKLYDGNCPTLVLTKKSCEQTFPNVKFETCRFHNDDGIDYSDFFRVLYENRVESLIVEGGRLLLQNLLDVGIGDELRVETNRTLFVGKGVEAPHFKQGESGYEKYHFQEVDDNEIVCYRKVNGLLTL